MGIQTGDINDLDLEALKARYREEREKRLRKEGEDQYIEAGGDFAEFYEIDPNSPLGSRQSISRDIDVLILGGGFAGLLAGANLSQQGVSNFQILDMASDFGGTWYWSRYPGVQCDIESYCYMPLLEELNYVPSEKYAHGPEIFAHCQRIGRHYGLYEKALFKTIVRSMKWDDAINRWRIVTNHNDDLRARFVIMCTGAYNRPKLPGIPGINSFKGKAFHSSRWDYGYTGGTPSDGKLEKLRDKRVAVIGSGATGVQIVPAVARYAKQLYVFQRTPSGVDVRGNRPTDPDWEHSLQPGWQRARQNNFNTMMFWGLPPGEDLVADGWTEVNRNLAAEILAASRGEISQEELAELKEREDFKLMERLRRRVDEIVDDRDTAEALKAWYRFNCKRPTFSDDYLPAFNQGNVQLIDVSSSKGVERITENSVIANGDEYDVDCIIFATGFEITTEMSRRFGISEITGRAERSLYDHWRDGFKTLHGMMAHGFPNQFFTGFTQAAISSNLTAMLDQQTNHIAYIIKETIDRGAASVEPTEDAEAEWVKTIKDLTYSMKAFYEACTPGVFNNEGGPVMRSYVGEYYSPGINAFDDLLRAWREAGTLDGLELRN